MAGEWILSENLEGAPQSIRPETHWFHETRPRKTVSGDAYGRVDGSLWFSLQLRRDRAEELYEWSRDGAFGGLIKARARMAPTSRTALRYALDTVKSDTFGADIFVPKEAFAGLEALPRDEISDAGLAVEGQISELPRADNEDAKSSPGPIAKDSPVIIAVIDDGIGIANHRFRQTAITTRVKNFLDLAVIGTPTAPDWADELLGRSWKSSDIDNLLAGYPDDEEQVYRALGLIDPLRDLRQPLRAAVTHGTHILDLAAGYDWQTGAEAEEAKKRPIIAVQLPTQVAENRSDTWLPQCLKRALDWILVKADELSAKISKEFNYVAPDGRPSRLPLVVNGSFASMAGPQDGYSDVERRISQFIETYRGDGPGDLCTFVLAAGNSLQLRAEAQMDILPGKSGEILLRVLPDDKTPNFVQIWLPKVGGHPQQPQVKVSLVPPRDAPVNEQPAVEWKIGKDPAARLDGAVEWRIGGNVGARIYHQCFPRPGGSRECITIATRPTVDDQESDPVVLVPSGLWNVQIENTTQQTLKNIDLRVHRDDPGMFSRGGARQSYFDDPDYVMFDPGSGRIINDEEQDRTRGTRVTRQGTLSSYAYANGVLVVGGYRRSDGEPAVYSSSGRHDKSRTEDAHGNALDGPDFAAVSEESPAVAGVLAAGTYSGSVAILSGTSVAAPQVTRALADKIANPASTAAVKVAGAANRLKAELEGLENNKAAVLSSQSSRPGREHYDKHRPLRDGVGRLFFESSYPRKRIED
jgi:hypothetical protein